MEQYSDIMARAHNLLAEKLSKDEIIRILVVEFPTATNQEIGYAVWDAEEHFE